MRARINWDPRQAPRRERPAYVGRATRLVVVAILISIAAVCLRLGGKPRMHELQLSDAFWSDTCAAFERREEFYQAFAASCGYPQLLPLRTSRRQAAAPGAHETSVGAVADLGASR